MNKTNHNHMMNVLFISVLFLCGNAIAQQATIRNPIAPKGQDPWVVQDDQIYYYCYSHKGAFGLIDITLFKEYVSSKANVSGRLPQANRIPKKYGPPNSTIFGAVGTSILPPTTATMRIIACMS